MRIAWRSSVYSLLCCLLVAAPHGLAQTYQGKQLVRPELLADTNAVVPGKPFTVGLLLRMAPGWHTYWKFSGDAGLPTELKWKLPPGWKVGDIQWPIPLKTIDPGDIETYGYENEVLLMQEITPPSKLDASSARLSTEANWLVCEKICIHFAVGFACSINKRAGKHGRFFSVSAFASSEAAGIQCGARRLEPGWIRSSLENYERNFGEISGSRFLSGAGAGGDRWASRGSIAEQQ
jgi:DsbC/DsbD-like thiol-disulfide interchange protein